MTRSFTLPPPVLPGTRPLRPVHQTPGDNQCLRCCVATIFGLAKEEVPFFGGALAFDEHEREMGGFGALQEREFRNWLRARGLEAVQLHRFLGDKEYDLSVAPWGLCIAHGPTERGTYHSVVWDAGYWDYPHPPEAGPPWPWRGRMVHDPHPSGVGLTRVDSWTCFAVMDPRRLGGKP